MAGGFYAAALMTASVALQCILCLGCLSMQTVWKSVGEVGVAALDLYTDQP